MSRKNNKPKVDQQKDEKSEGKKEEKTTIELVRDIAIALGAIVGVITGIIAIINSLKNPEITINNYLNLPIMVVINDSSAYTSRVEAGSSRTFTLKSNDDFPAKVEWKTILEKNGAGDRMGEVLQNVYERADKGETIDATNVIAGQIYFYPVIHNNTDLKCTIIVNDGLYKIGHIIGDSNPGKTTSITGYFKYAANSNVTFECPGKPSMWHGERDNVVSPGGRLIPQKHDGVVEISFP